MNLRPAGVCGAGAAGNGPAETGTGRCSGGTGNSFGGRPRDGPRRLRRRRLLEGKPWATIDLAKAAKSSNADLSQLSGSLDPTNQLDQLRAVGQVKRVGSDTIRGASTTHYHAVVDLEQALRLRPPKVRARLRPSIDELERQTNSTKLPIDAWIDPQKRIRRMTAEFAHIGSMRMDLYDYGRNLRVAVPPADQTTDITAQATG